MRWHECRAKVRFHEVDSFKVLWHGNYIKYFEIGRLAFSKEHGLAIERLSDKGLYAPVIDLGCTFKEPARYGDEIIIRTAVDPTEIASLTFRYMLLRESDRKTLAEGFTTHVLMTLDGKMLYLIPEDLKIPLQEMIAWSNG